MNDNLRDRILRKLETLGDERGYQVLDYVEFLESRYAQRAAPTANIFQQFAEGVEDRLRAGRVSASTITQTMGLLNQAVGVLNGVAAAGKSVASDLMTAATTRTAPPGATPPNGTSANGTPADGTPGASGASGGTGAPAAAPTTPPPTGEPR